MEMEEWRNSDFDCESDSVSKYRTREVLRGDAGVLTDRTCLMDPRKRIPPPLSLSLSVFLSVPSCPDVVQDTGLFRVDGKVEERASPRSPDYSFHMFPARKDKANIRFLFLSQRCPAARWLPDPAGTCARRYVFQTNTVHTRAHTRARIFFQAISTGGDVKLRGDAIASPATFIHKLQFTAIVRALLPSKRARSRIANGEIRDGPSIWYRYTRDARACADASLPCPR